MERFNGPLYHFLRSLWDVDEPNPYGTVEFIEKGEGPEIALCLNCLAPECGHQWICAECGWPSSFYGSQMPFIDVYCMGALFRSGVDGSVELTKFRIIGLIVYSIANYHIFAPLYWYWVFQARKGNPIKDVDLKNGNRFYLNRKAHEYSKYNLDELFEAYREIDREEHAERYQSLLQEFERRSVDPCGRE